MSAVKKLIPLMDRVLVERAVAATKTSGGILLPETVGSKVSRMNSHSHSSSSSSSSSSLVFFL
jgi:chaperonin GroES